MTRAEHESVMTFIFFAAVICMISVLLIIALIDCIRQKRKAEKERKRIDEIIKNHNLKQ